MTSRVSDSEDEGPQVPLIHRATLSAALAVWVTSVESSLVAPYCCSTADRMLTDTVVISSMMLRMLLISDAATSDTVGFQTVGS